MRRIPALFFLLAVGILVHATPAQARIEGDCRMTVEGEDLGSDGVTIAAPEDGELDYHIESSIPVTRWSVTLHYGPFERLVLDRGLAGATSENGTFSIGEYTKYGTGLYRVTGRAELADGTTCTGSMDLKVGGSIWTSALGLAAVAVLGAAGVGILLTVLQIVFDAKDVVEAAKDFVEQAKVGKAALAAPEGKPPQGPPP